MSNPSHVQPGGYGAPLKKKSKTTSTSFTPYNKSSTQSDIHLPLQRFSIVGLNETPLAMMQQKIETFYGSTSPDNGQQLLSG